MNNTIRTILLLVAWFDATWQCSHQMNAYVASTFRFYPCFECSIKWSEFVIHMPIDQLGWFPIWWRFAEYLRRGDLSDDTWISRGWQHHSASVQLFVKSFLRSRHYLYKWSKVLMWQKENWVGLVVGFTPRPIFRI
jgi:hypothetical protein